MATTVTVTLVSRAQVPQSGLSGLRWAWYDVAPWTSTATTYVDAGASEVTDGSGELSITITGSILTNGQSGYLALADEANAYYALIDPIVVVT